MITHSISKYGESTKKDVIDVKYTAVKPTQAMGKLDFALFLKNLGYGAGDFVTSRYNVGTPLSIHNVQYVQHVDEIHHLVMDWGDNVRGPCIITLRSANYGKGWRGGAKSYVKVKRDDVPKEWWAVVDKEGLHINEEYKCSRMS